MGVRSDSRCNGDPPRPHRNSLSAPLCNGSPKTTHGASFTRPQSARLSPQQTANENSIMSDELFISARHVTVSHTHTRAHFHFTTDSLHLLARCSACKRRALSVETQTPAAPVRGPTPPPLLSTAHPPLMSLMMCVSTIASVNMLFNMAFRNPLTT